jgi:sec-independent protein translocase protein TatB
VFNIGPGEFLVLAIVGLIVVGPDKLPGMARDAARMIKTLRELAHGAREQLREELGPDLAYLADTDPRKLNPRHVLGKAMFGDTDLNALNPASLIKDTFADVKEVGDSVVQSIKAEIAADPVPESPPVQLTKQQTPALRSEPDPAAGPRFDPDAT